MVDRRVVGHICQEKLFLCHLRKLFLTHALTIFNCRLYYEAVQVEKVTLVFVEAMEEEKEAGKSAK